MPAGFVLDACVDGAGLTLRNSLDVPVVVTGRGVEEPVRTSSVGAERETVLRLVREDKVVLLPGDVVRWPIGRGAAALTVSELEPAAAPAIVEVLDPFLPREGPRRIPDAVLQAFADVVEPIDDAVAEREACLDDQNFLGAVACDVTTAAAIATALDVEFSRGVATEVAPAVLDRGQWAEWAGIGTADISGTDTVLRQEDVAAPGTSTLDPASASRSTRPDPVPQGPAPAAGSRTGTGRRRSGPAAAHQRQRQRERPGKGERPRQGERLARGSRGVARRLTDADQSRAAASCCHSLGDIPNAARKRRAKWLGSAKPQARATEAIDRRRPPGEPSTTRASSSRWLMIHCSRLRPASAHDR